MIETKLDESLYPAKLTPDMDETFFTVAKKILDGPTIEPLSAKDLEKLPAVDFNSHAVVKIKEEIAKGNLTLPKIPVVAYPYFEFGIQTAEHQHIEENGISESKYLTLVTDVNNFDPNVVWIGDAGYPFDWKRWCNKFGAHVLTAQKKRIAQGLPRSWPIYVLDFTDGWSRQRCTNIEEAVGSEFVHYSKRSRVNGRWWHSGKNWVTEGHVRSIEEKGKTYKHSPLVVRTDTIESLKHALDQRGMKLSDPIETIKRKVDVTHLWPVGELDKAVGHVQSNLRHLVSNYLDQLGKETDLNVYVGLAGKAVKEGRRGVASAYIEAMLRTKILVITQRDGWEDHYRLFEGLVSGAMVMTDRMMSKPADIVNGTSIVDFTSLDDLKAKILYYLNHKKERLEIARRGRLAAMSRHRTWHRMEEIIFGNILSNCTKNPACPYIVHASEGRRRR